jgi:hypothetical protein
MIRYSLTCAKTHSFDSWFADASAYEALQRAGQITCPVCGSARVEKALMAPAVRPARRAAAAQGPVPGQGPAESAAGTRPALSEPASEIEAKLAELRRQVEANSEYVGMGFAAEARRIHDGEAPERPIYGEARPDEARRLIEDGVPVAPLPFRPSRKTN